MSDARLATNRPAVAAGASLADRLAVSALPAADPSTQPAWADLVAVTAAAEAAALPALLQQAGV
ncbi:hypothetical protein ABTL87_19770, partial [Acinetobacter baumannii]